MRFVTLGLGLGLLLLAGCAGRPLEPRVRPQSAKAVQPAKGVQHTVVSGQTLWRIATAYGLSVDRLADANDIDAATTLETGMKLFVPGATHLLDIPEYPADPRGARVADARRSSPVSPPAPVRIEDNSWTWPVPGGRLISKYGVPRGSRRHAGLDIKGSHGAPVVAALAGRVTYSDNTMRGYGKTVILDHGNGLRTLYAHNSELLVRHGQRVERGATIARVGQTGNASGPHCHFEMQRHLKPFDPMTLRVVQRGPR